MDANHVAKWDGSSWSVVGGLSGAWTLTAFDDGSGTGSALYAGGTARLQGIVCLDTDGDGVMDCNDGCPGDPLKALPGICRCGAVDDADGDGVNDCGTVVCWGENKYGQSTVPAGLAGVVDIAAGSLHTVALKADDTVTCWGYNSSGQCTVPAGLAGVVRVAAGVYHTVALVRDLCPNDPTKFAPGACGCGIADTDSDDDGTPDCIDECPTDPDKTAPGTCGCGVSDLDSDDDGTPDCDDERPRNPSKTAPGLCGCDFDDGALAWSGLGAFNGPIYAVTTFDDGSGPALYVGGDFTRVGTLNASRIAKWDGSTWSRRGSGTNGLVRALAVFDDRNGPELYVGGNFSSARRVPGTRAIARWNGATWSTVGQGLSPNSLVAEMTEHRVGPGNQTELVVAGLFTAAGSVVAANIARWKDGSWAALGSGALNCVNGFVGALHSLETTPNALPELIVGGSFTKAGGTVSARSLAAWETACIPFVPTPMAPPAAEELTEQVSDAVSDEGTDADLDGVPDAIDGCEGFPDHQDCNGNGEADGCDVIDGRSEDRNGNLVPDECECVGDLNGDGLVDGADLGALLVGWGTSGVDLNSDGTTDGADLGILLAAWGACG